jgi:ABC-2 type transport system permease protein
MPVYDQGYQHWKGHLSGHAWRWLAIARHGIRTQLRAQLKGWYVRRLIFLAWIPPMMLVAALAVWGMVEQGVLGAENWLPFFKKLAGASDLHECRQAVWTISYSIFFQTELFFIMLIVAVAGPNLISRDMRFNALPLYLSRPLTRYDYFLGKLGIIGGIVAALAVIPAVVAYVLGVCFSLDLSVIRDTWRLLPASIVYGMIIVISAGTLMLALSSLSRRSLYVGLAWIAIWLISTSVSALLDGIHQSMIRAAVWQKQQADSLEATPSGAPGKAFYWDDKEVQRALAEAAKTDWRPLLSYPANLKRLGDAALDTDGAWVKIVRAINSSQSSTNFMMDVSTGRWPTKSRPQVDERYLANQNVPQYPWTWSATVLAGILVLSAWILSIRIKSLDRLR